MGTENASLFIIIVLRFYNFIVIFTHVRTLICEKAIDETRLFLIRKENFNNYVWLKNDWLYS